MPFAADGRTHIESLDMGDKRDYVIDFAYGNASMENPKVTREMVTRAYDRIHQQENDAMSTATGFVKLCNVRGKDVYARGMTLRFGKSTKAYPFDEHPQWSQLTKSERRAIRRAAFRAGARRIAHRSVHPKTMALVEVDTQGNDTQIRMSRVAVKPAKRD